jgi:hypothetical protein
MVLKLDEIVLFRGGSTPTHIDLCETQQASIALNTQNPQAIHRGIHRPSTMAVRDSFSARSPLNGSDSES